jgi:hypothetical protein
MQDSSDSGKAVVLAALEELTVELTEGCDWENDSLKSYLESLAALLGSIENHYGNVGQPVPNDPWVVIADAIRGARYYE